MIRVAAQRTKKKSTDPLDPNVEEWVFAVSAFTQETPVMLKAGLLTAPKFAMPTSASGRTVKSSCSNERAMACTARALPFSVTVEQESFSLSRRLVQLHLQADHRQCHVKSESTKEFSDAKKNRPRYAT